MAIIVKGRCVVKGKAAGKALVSTEPICFVGGINTKTGILTEIGHELYGQCVAGKVLVFPTGKGSTGGSYVLFEAVSNGVGPCAIINCNIEQVTAVGCIISEIPTLDRLEANPIEFIKSGDFVEVNATEGFLKVIKKEE
jgi:predicted aconitase with swiveling domain